jgi:tetratricopeptide (TPR) repeat protein
MTMDVHAPAGAGLAPPPIASQQGQGSPHDSWWRPDRMSLGILGGFAVLSLLIIWHMWPTYQSHLHDARGQYYFDWHEYEKAIPNLEYFRNDAAGSTYRQQDLGWSYYMTGQPAKALERFEFVKTHNLTVKVDMQIGLCLLDQNKLDEAEQYLRRALTPTPDNPKANEEPYANYGMGRIMLLRGKPQNAAAYFQAVAKLDNWYEPARRADLDTMSDPFRRTISEQVLHRAPDTTATTQQTKPR